MGLSVEGENADGLMASNHQRAEKKPTRESGLKISERQFRLEISLFREGLHAGVEDFDVHFGAGRRGPCFGESHFGLKQFAFELGEFLGIDEGTRHARRAGGAVGRRNF